MRLQNSPQDTSFAQWLLDIGHDRGIDNDGNINIPPSMVSSSEDELIHQIYGDINHLPLTPPPIDYFLDHVIFAPHNVDVQQMNEKILDKMQGRKIIYDSADSRRRGRGNTY